MATNSIGAFNFVSLSGPRPGQPLDLEHQVVELRQRPGTDGTASRVQGRKGEPFEVRTTVDAADYLAGVQLIRLYTLAEAIEPLVVVHGGVNYHDQFRTKYDVLRVTPVTVRPSPNHVGMLASDSTAIVVARWLLLPVSSA